MTQWDKIHKLFNELHRELCQEWSNQPSPQLNDELDRLASTVDATHHDFMNYTEGTAE